jgi:hypothetical protein
MLVPNEPKDFTAIYETHFRGMTAVPTSAEMLLEYRARLLRRIADWLTPESRAFLESVEAESPNFDLIGWVEMHLDGEFVTVRNLARR